MEWKSENLSDVGLSGSIYHCRETKISSINYHKENTFVSEDIFI